MLLSPLQSYLNSNACLTLSPLPKEQQLNVNDSSPPVQKRLAAQAHSPRKEISLDDINTKLEQANKRKEENLASATSKTVAHNARVEQVYEQSKEKETHKIKALEEHITSKLDNAEAKRDDTKSSWVSVMLLFMFYCLVGYPTLISHATLHNITYTHTTPYRCNDYHRLPRAS